MMDRLLAMETFVRVAEAGSFAAVAERLNLARSVVTRQIAALEAHLGVKLLTRSTRSLHLTPEGAAYLEKCRDILGLVAAAEGDLAGERQAPRGVIRMSLPMSLGLRRLMPLLADFAGLYPEVEVMLEFSDRRVNLVEEGFDLALRVSTRLDPGSVARRLGTSRMAVVAAPAYLERHGHPARPEALLEHQCLGYTLAPQSSWTFLIDGAWRSVPVRGRFQANNGDALLEAAERGLGITCQPTFITAEAVRAGRLLQLLPDFPLPELDIHALFPGHRYLPHRVRVLADYLAERIGSPPFWERA
ncbi:LysR family transcriptional regulator [Azovibrio restrictus]|uniref:LysR family transcriptional regulator n=1 Tax=Azovibrio restrictus TaxID=146938 RepID=UPI0026F28B38|nr:LysR family transcriptional regulator [Azovibrio restrictus]MDD3484686.1 LysR family transcriptional regulator [Azovibrio restrictus]